MLLAPLVRGQTGEFRDVLEKARREGFVRVRVDGKIVEVDGTEPVRLAKGSAHHIEAVVDRLVLREGVRTRLSDSVETALRWGKSQLAVLFQEPSEPGKTAADDNWQEVHFSTDYRDPETGFTLPQLTAKHFSFNSHLGACPTCHGIGSLPVLDPELMVPDPQKSLAEGAVAPWQRSVAKRMRAFYQSALRDLAERFDAPMDRPFAELPAAFRQALFHGAEAPETVAAPRQGKARPAKEKPARAFEGLVAQLQHLLDTTKSELTRHRLRAYTSPHPCPECHGARLRPEMLAVTLTAAGGPLNIREFCRLTIAEAYDRIQNVELGAMQRQVAAEIVREVTTRLGFLVEVGLGYLNLDRESGSLSGGESQRIRLAAQIGSRLAGVLYVLDEPSIGLPPAR